MNKNILHGEILEIHAYLHWIIALLIFDKVEWLSYILIILGIFNYLSGFMRQAKGIKEEKK